MPNNPFHYYATKAEKLAAEQRAGRRVAIRNQAEALIDQMQRKYGWIGKFTFDTHDSDEPTDWTVTFQGNKMPVVDNWTDFPSNEFITILMLLGEKT